MPHLPCPAQVIRCQHLAAGEPFLQEWLATFRPETSASAVHRCAAVLDGPLVPGEQQSLLVMPPGALPGTHAVHAVRGLALSTSTKACPPDRCGAGLLGESGRTLHGLLQRLCGQRGACAAAGVLSCLL